MNKYRYNWDLEFENYFKYPYSFTVIKSCIEADEPYALSEVVGSHKNAKIYALILCFTLNPSVKCIHYLISENTPLNETFKNNPFQCTPDEYLQTKFNTSHKVYIKARSLINQTIAKAQLEAKNRDHTTIYISNCSIRDTIMTRFPSAITSPKKLF
jgi:hypothetical protein